MQNLVAKENMSIDVKQKPRSGESFLIRFAPFDPRTFNPVGKYLKNDEKRNPWILTDANVISGGNGAGGTWSFTNGSLVLTFAQWYGPSTCRPIDKDTFDDGVNKFRRVLK